MENASPQLMQALRTYIDHHHIDIHRMLSENGGKRSSCGSGSMLKCKFLSVLNEAFHRMNLPQADLHALASAFGTGPMDRNAGGFLEVRWMAFVRELMALQPNSRWNTPQGTPRAADMPPLNTAEAQEYQNALNQQEHMTQGDHLMMAKVQHQHQRAA